MNNNTKVKVSVGIGASWIVLAVALILSYFVYNRSIEAVGAFFVWGFFATILLFLTLIPFAGVVVYGLVFKLLVEPWIFGLTGLYSTWLTEAIFWTYIIIGIIITLVTTLIALAFGSK